MQFLLQAGNASQFLRLLTPLVEALGNGLVDFQAFVQEDANQIVVGGVFQALAKAGRGFFGFCRRLFTDFQFFQFANVALTRL